MKDGLLWIWKNEILWMIIASIGFFLIGKTIYQSWKRNRNLMSQKKEAVSKEKLSRMLDHAERINDYFANAVRAYAFKEDESARCAAFAAAKVASKKQRDSMALYLSSMKSDFNYSDQTDKYHSETIAIISRRLVDLKRDIETKDWDLDDIREEKERLSKIDPEYLDSLNRADPTIFIRKYPELF